MAEAIGMIEFKTTPGGILAADYMVKTAQVELLESKTVCPGKYIAFVTGELSAVRSAVDAAAARFEGKCIDSFVLGNPHESVLAALRGENGTEQVESLGILETYDVASAIVAADAAAKTSLVDIIAIKTAEGLGGKSYFVLTGSVAAVEAAVEEAVDVASARGMYLDSSVIPHPDPQIGRLFL